MNTKSILLAYATRYGSTQEVAETIAATLREAGLEVDTSAHAGGQDACDAMMRSCWEQRSTMPGGTRMHTISCHNIRKPSSSCPWRFSRSAR